MCISMGHKKSNIKIHSKTTSRKYKLCRQKQINVITANDCLHETEKLPVGSMHQYCEDKHHTMQLPSVHQGTLNAMLSSSIGHKRKNAYSKKDKNNNISKLRRNGTKWNNVLNTCVSIHFNHTNTCLKSFPTSDTWFSMRYEKSVRLWTTCCILSLAACVSNEIEWKRSSVRLDHGRFQCQSWWSTADPLSKIDQEPIDCIRSTIPMILLSGAKQIKWKCW